VFSKGWASHQTGQYSHKLHLIFVFFSFFPEHLFGKILTFWVMMKKVWLRPVTLIGDFTVSSDQDG
jgi:hypothetical protein